MATSLQTTKDRLESEILKYITDNEEGKERHAYISLMDYLQSIKGQEIILDQDMINKYKGYLLQQYSSETVRKYIYKVSKFLKCNYDLELDYRMKYTNDLTRSDIKKILNNDRISQRDKYIIQLLLTGLNAETVANITLEEIQESKHIKANLKQEIIDYYLQDQAEHGYNDVFIFHSEMNNYNQNHITERTINNICLNAGVKTELDKRVISSKLVYFNSFNH